MSPVPVFSAISIEAYYLTARIQQNLMPMPSIGARLRKLERRLAVVADTNKVSLGQIMDALDANNSHFDRIALADLFRNAILCRQDGDIEIAEILEATYQFHLGRLIDRLKASIRGDGL